MLKHYADMNDTPLSSLLRQASINNEKQLMGLFDSSWQSFPDTGRSTVACIILYQCDKIDHDTHVQSPVFQSIA